MLLKFVFNRRLIEIGAFFKDKYLKAELFCASDAHNDAHDCVCVFESVSLFPSIQRLQITSFMLLLWIQVGLCLWGSINAEFLVCLSALFMSEKRSL